MIKIIKHGDKIFKAECRNCGCEFIYELTDLMGNIIFCPDCSAVVSHSAIAHKIENNENVKCSECKYLMFSDCYGECSKGYKGIVRPTDTCENAERK